MGRARLLKPEFFTDSAVVRCSPLARLFFAGSWCCADDNGILPDDMLQLKMQVLPGDAVDGEELKCELVGGGLWIPFRAEDKPWILITGFRKHQALDRPFTIYPVPTEDVLVTLGYAVDVYTYSRNGHPYQARVLYDTHTPYIRRIGTVYTPRKERKRKEKKGREDEVEKDAAADAATTAADLFVQTWNALGTPFKPVQHLGSRQKALAARWREPWWREHWSEAMAHLQACAFVRGQNERGWVGDVEWFLRPDTVAKVLEGKYDDKPAGGNGEKPPAAVMSKTDW